MPSNRNTVIRSLHDVGAAAWLRVLQWVTPVLTGALVILGAQQGEQQRPAERLRGLGRKAARKAAGHGHDLQDLTAQRSRDVRDLLPV